MDKEKSFENIRDEYFLDPRKMDQPVLAQLTSRSIRAMSQIYAGQGSIDLMSPDIQKWLNGDEREDEISKILAEALRRESFTRRFDHKFMGQIHPQGNMIAVLGNIIATYMNTNTVSREVSLSENEMERESLLWLSDIFGYDKKQFSGNFTVGGTTANIEALWVARKKKECELIKSGKNVKKANLFVIGTKMAHYSVDKACDLLGIDFYKTEPVNFKTDINNVAQAIEDIKKADKDNEVVAIIGLAGETETGLIDDLDGFADVAQNYGIFYHVDAAYGGPFILSRQEKLFKGIDRADSITIDPHKMLYTPYSAGSVLFKDIDDHLLISKVHDIRYLRDVAVRVEGSMGSGGVIATWLTIELLGKNGFAKLLDHTLDLTEYAYNKVLMSNVLKPMFKPETNTILIGLRKYIHDSMRREERNKLISNVRETIGTHGYYISEDGEIDNGSCALRFVSMHPYATRQNVEESLELLEKKVCEELLPYKSDY